MIRMKRSDNAASMGAAEITSRIATLALTLMLALTMVFPVGSAGNFAYAAEDDAGITYTITVYSGDSGKFSDGSTVKKFVGRKYGDAVYIDVNSGDTKIVVNSDVADKYYARGFKLAGHDNDEMSQLQLVSYNHKVTEDASFTVAYGMKGGMVKYTINYVDENGNELLPSAEYYGMAGDYPVVSYQYIEGYAPNAYNLGRTLTDDEGSNVFTFTYSPSTLTAEQQRQQAVNPATPGARPGNAAGTPGANAADGTTIGDNATPLADTPNVVDLDNGDVPLAEPDNNTEPGELSTQRLIALIIGGACAVALIAAIVAILIKRRRDGEYDEDEEEELDEAIEQGKKDLEDAGEDVKDLM